MKKFYLLILKSYLRSFFPTFVIVMLILLMQMIWLYVDELIGKGLDWLVIAELLFYFSASLIPQALPLSVLLASIMTFGALGESYELVAARASGISIWKTFRPMFGLMILIALFGFFVSNVLIPESNLKRGALLYSVRQQKPSLAIREGVFSQDIPGIIIRVGKKDEQKQELKEIIIYDKRESQLHPVILYAKRGNMKMSEDGRYLFLNLYEGGRYEELERVKGYYYSQPHTTTLFNEERIAFDLNSFKFNRSDENMFKQHWEMLNVLELKNASDSLLKVKNSKSRELAGFVKPYYFFTKIKTDSLLAKSASPMIPVSNNEASISSHFPKAIPSVLFGNALNNTRSVKNIIEYSINEYKELNKVITRHQIEWHRKFILAIACIVMFFIGAPLGSIIRKGGFGLPIVVSVLFYLCYHIVSISGEKAAKTFAWTPFQGMWLGIAVFIPIGLFISWKASNDSALFNFNPALLFDNLISWFRKRKKTPNPA